ncbi:DUF3772 domain-containing protein [Nissabacter sp. SGAir0207]|uniref:DUF3772 domain-containing protein n=1 Tax=Nissabacter sp. SGAir0207 TaxID=2126321 RepID=UPI001F0DCCBB|nr:DUF3772 domain-containing protein [Nissabacter sp. SGAir0207]
MSQVAHAAPDAAATGEESAKPAAINAPATLAQLQKRLDNIKQQVSNTTSDNKLSALNDSTLQLAADADALSTALQPALAQAEAQLAVLGPEPADDALAETADVARQRTSLNKSQQQLKDQIDQASAINAAATNLSAQITNLRRNALKTQLALNTGSILGHHFWSPLLDGQANDARRFTGFTEQLHASWSTAWEPEWRYGSVALLVAALAIGLFGRRLLDKPLTWLVLKALPEGRLRRSALAAGTVLTVLLSVGIAAQLLCQIVTREGSASQMVLDYAEGVVDLSLFSALIAGLGQALLANQHPSWRLPTMANEIAQTLRPFPLMLASFILVFGAMEQLNNLIGVSVVTSLMGSGLASLLVALTAFIGPMRVNRLRRRYIAEGETPEARSTLVGLVHLATSVTAFVILMAVLVGYIPLARFLSYELVWIGLVLGCLYLLIHLVTDVCESLFSANTASGRIIKHSLNIQDRHLTLAATLLSAIGKSILILLAVVAILNGTFGTTTPLELISKVVDIWGGKGLEKLNIVPSQLINAVICLVVGMVVLRSARRWLDNDFLPKTMMDKGIRASLVTLFSNVGYVLVILITLSAMGIQWNKLAWIVSALSVGIGFGLQEIVKNFISGLILLTERPVKVGDLVTISGVEGDIRRINVRATEIQLSDRSTVIVPNSQLISQNVRNATMNNAQGVATIALTFPLDIDPEQVRGILLQAYQEHQSILEMPAPSVTFSQLAPTGIVLSVTGYVTSPRVVSSTKSELLYDILKRLRAEKVSLSMPQKMVLEAPEDRQG